MVRLVKGLLLCLVWGAAGCTNSGGEAGVDSTAPFLPVYTAYVEDVQAGQFPQNIETYFSREAIRVIKEGLRGSKITVADVGWLIHSSYLKRSSIGNNFHKYKGDELACFTVIGKSHEGLPMFVNLEFVLEDKNWRINKVSGFSTDGSAELEFPTTAQCPDPMAVP